MNGGPEARDGFFVDEGGSRASSLAHAAQSSTTGFMLSLLPEC